MYVYSFKLAFFWKFYWLTWEEPWRPRGGKEAGQRTDQRHKQTKRVVLKDVAGGADALGRLLLAKEQGQQVEGVLLQELPVESSGASDGQVAGQLTHQLFLARGQRPEQRLVLATEDEVEVDQGGGHGLQG